MPVIQFILWTDNYDTLVSLNILCCYWIGFTYIHCGGGCIISYWAMCPFLSLYKWKVVQSTITWWFTARTMTLPKSYFQKLQSPVVQEINTEQFIICKLWIWNVATIIYNYISQKNIRRAELFSASVPAVSAIVISNVYQLSQKIFGVAFPNLIGTYPRG